MTRYARKGDTLLFSTTVDRVKGRTLSRDPRTVLTVINEDEPDSFVSVEGEVTIHRDNPQELRDFMVDTFAASGREFTLKLFAEPGRAVFELTPMRVSGFLVPDVRTLTQS